VGVSEELAGCPVGDLQRCTEPVEVGDTVESIHRTYAHWLRDDRAGMARALDEILAEGVADDLGEEAGS
jgi:hypothetical protein